MSIIFIKKYQNFVWVIEISNFDIVWNLNIVIGILAPYPRN